MIPTGAIAAAARRSAGGGGGTEGPTPTVAEAGTSWNSGTASTSFNTAYPGAAVAAGNVAIVFLIGWNAVGTSPTWTIATPAGWNLLTGPLDAVDLSIANSGRVYAFWRRLDGTESGTLTITATATVRFRSGRMVIFSGCAATGTPYEGLGTNTNGGTSSADPQSLNIGTTAANRLGFVYIGVDDNTGGLTPAAGWSAIWNEVDATSNTHTQGVTKALASAGTEPAYNPTNLSTAEAWGVISLALLPEPTS